MEIEPQRDKGKRVKCTRRQGEQCSTCDYYAVVRDHRCHRYPPLPINGGYHFPYVEEWEWCGEYSKI
jgi:hypothetical protein